MSRRNHKKSRNGCLECKRRHVKVRLVLPPILSVMSDYFVKCDEKFPICANCGAAEIQCSFLRRASPYVSPISSHVATSSPTATASFAVVARPFPGSLTRDQEVSDLYSVDMTHLGLFDNLSSSDFLSIEDAEQPNTIPTAIYKKYALTTPYQMHQLLAISAFHLSTKNTETCDVYREYATGLQSRALALFNESNPALEVTQSNCVNMFLFSSGLGVYLLCDTLVYHRAGLADFINHFTNCLDVYRGVLTIIDQGRDLLQATELGARLKISQLAMQPSRPTGSECDALRDFIKITEISPSSRKAYQETILHLQRTLDAQCAASERIPSVRLLLAWPILVSCEYVSLLRQQQPEALIILAYYSVQLHRGRNLWLIGDSGRFLIESICASLGPNWQVCLKWPKDQLCERRS
jgi:hypothetical protein